MTSADLRSFIAALQSAQGARRVDRAAVATTAILQIVRNALAAWLERDRADLAGVRVAIEGVLRDEFDDIKRQTISEIRHEDE